MPPTKSARSHQQPQQNSQRQLHQQRSHGAKLLRGNGANSSRSVRNATESKQRDVEGLEGLLEHDDEEDETKKEEGEVDDDVLAEIDATLPEAPQDASKLSMKAVAQELELRNLKPSGFQGEDVKALQAIFDEEFEEDLRVAKERRAQLILQKQQELEEAKLQRQREREKQEEELALAKNPRVRFWIAGITPRKCPRDAQLHYISPPLCRALCKPLQRDQWITSLDLSNSKLDDGSGVLLAQALSTNKGIQRLELESCGLGPETLRAFSAVLEENTTLAHVTFENNALTGVNGDELDGIYAFSQSLQHNITIRMLNVWRTGLGEIGGNALAAGLEFNNTLLSLGVGCNGISNTCEAKITCLLDRNAQRKRLADQKAYEERLRIEQIEAERKRIEDKRLADEEEERWLERRKVERAEARLQKKREEQQRIEEEKRRLEEERLAAEEAERQRLEAKKKKKKKGKKKK